MNTTLTRLEILDATHEDFARAFLAARATSPTVAAYTDDDVPAGQSYYLTADGMSGFTVDAAGDFGHLFSLVKGRGDSLVLAAIERGARTLNAFDGYLPTLYGRHGFAETARVANWTPGEPDVVYMTLTA